MTDPQEGVGRYGSWPTLAQRKPEPGQRCEYILLDTHYSSHGFGTWREDDRAAGFQVQDSLFVSDPTITYWQAL